MNAGSLLLLALLAGCSSPVDVTMSDAQAEEAAPRSGGDLRRPVVIELFQSQGCSSCPPANANLNSIADRPDLLALSFAVTYWDRLGWKDRFAKPAFTERQWDYARSGGRGRVFTPQLIFNGGTMMLGGDRQRFHRLIRDTPPLAGGPPIDAMGDVIVIGAGRPTQSATAWLVRYDPRVRQVAIRAGENGGRTLPHRNIVTELRELGAWTGREQRFSAGKSSDPSWKMAVLLQQGEGGPLVAARKF